MIIEKGETNWNYILVILILAILVGGGILWWTNRQDFSIEFPEVNKSRKEEPYIKVVSPNGGEEWIEGNTYEIIWESSGVERVAITAAVGGKDKGHINFGLNANLGIYSWKIPTGFIAIFGAPRTDLVKIRIYEVRNQDLYDENDNYFSIIAE